VGLLQYGDGCEKAKLGRSLLRQLSVPTGLPHNDPWAQQGTCAREGVQQENREKGWEGDEFSMSLCGLVGSVPAGEAELFLPPS